MGTPSVAVGAKSDEMATNYNFVFQLEKSLKGQIDVWEQEHGKEFLVNGQKFLEYVQQQWDHHHTEKEKEKLERVCY